MEVLKAAKDESRTALLVYASERAVNYESGDLPPQLRVSICIRFIIMIDNQFTSRVSLISKQNFVRADNLAFAAELEESRRPKSMTPTKRKAEDDTVDVDNSDPNWGGYQDNDVSPPPNKCTEASILDSADPTLPRYTPIGTSLPGPFPTNSRRGSLAKKPNITSYDESIPLSLRATGSSLEPTSMAIDEDSDISLMPAGQEMQQRGAGSSLGPRGNTGVAAAYHASNYPTEIKMEDGEDDDSEARHVEFAQ